MTARASGAPRAGVASAISYLQNEDACNEGQATLIYLAEEMARDLYSALDAINIPNGVIK